MSNRIRIYAALFFSFVYLAGLYAAAPLFLHPNINQMLTNWNFNFSSKTLQEAKQITFIP